VRIISDGIAYDTDKATKVVGGDNAEWSEAWWGLYRTPAGAFFKIVVDHDGENLLECRTLTDLEAQTCVEKHANGLVEEYFGPMPEPGSPQAKRSPMGSSPALPGHRPKLLTLKPTFWGIGIDLKEAWVRCRALWRGDSR
jgi:hypothetical protein